MKNRRIMTVGVVSIVTALLFPDYAMADNGYEHPSEAYAKTQTASDTADVEIIDEIIVRGRKQSWRPGLRLTSGFDPLLKRFQRFDWQFFPTYVPEPIRIRFELGHFRNTNQQAGIIEVFRIRFGHHGNGN